MANLFSKSVNLIPLKVLIALAITGSAVIAGVTYYFTPKYTRVGYQPTQPVAFDHSLHVGQLGMDCRYCHNFVDESGHSNVPSTNTCMNCHSMVLADSPKLAPVRESWNTGEPIEWVRIHKTPDYVYFNHAIHVNRGISCVHCHGQINEMEVVHHAEPLSMGFCLECHKNPEKYIREPENVYDLTWEAESRQAQLQLGEQLVHDWNINPPISCSGCHR